jgi:DNA-binding transcriptional MerR regulator/uncharacterized glyoxalase superfamily protein PhnB
MRRDDSHAGHKIGELAQASGLTVRTLHYYDEIGLLVASQRTAASHRLYTDADVERLYRITLLQQLGLPLADVGRALDDPTWDMQSALTAHRHNIARRIEAEQRLHDRIVRLLASLDGSEPSIANDLLTILEDMTMLDTNVQRRISILVYADLATAYDYLARVFQLGPGELTRDGDGNPVHGEIQAGDGVVWLHPESTEFGLASPRSLGASTGCTAVLVADVDAHFAHARDNDAEIAYEPVDQPYGYREYGARDTEGHLWSFMKALD